MHRSHARGFIGLLATALASACVAAPVESLPEGFEGQFEFRISDSVVLTADLKLPHGSARKAPYPLVVVMHGGAGVHETDAQYADAFATLGYAAVVVDSFGGRGYRPDLGTGAGASLRPTVRVVEAYRVLAVLATDPQIDAKRAVLFGRSHSATTAMIAATAWAKNRYAPGGPSYAGFIGLYPTCSIVYPEFVALNAPLRLHLGLKDELTPAKPCQAIVDRMQGLGQDAKATSYEEAHHAFDFGSNVGYFAKWVNYSNCNLNLPSVDAELPVDEVGRCARRGTSMGGNPKAASLMRKNVEQELAAFFP
jgi:dienelactone hydrolase